MSAEVLTFDFQNTEATTTPKANKVKQRLENYSRSPLSKTDIDNKLTGADSKRQSLREERLTKLEKSNQMWKDRIHHAKELSEKERQKIVEKSEGSLLKATERRDTMIQELKNKAHQHVQKSLEIAQQQKEEENKLSQSLNSKQTEKLEQAKTRRSSQLEATKAKAHKTQERMAKFMTIVKEKGVFKEE